MSISMTWPQYLRHECRIGAFPIELSANQAELLLILMLRSPNAVPMVDLIEMVFPDPDAEPDQSEDAIRALMHRLRHRVGSYRIQMCGGFGYRLRQEPDRFSTAS